MSLVDFKSIHPRHRVLLLIPSCKCSLCYQLITTFEIINLFVHTDVTILIVNHLIKAYSKDCTESLDVNCVPILWMTPRWNSNIGQIDSCWVRLREYHNRSITFKTIDSTDELTFYDDISFLTNQTVARQCAKMLCTNVLITFEWNGFLKPQQQSAVIETRLNIITKLKCPVDRCGQFGHNFFGCLKRHCPKLCPLEGDASKCIECSRQMAIKYDKCSLGHCLQCKKHFYPKNGHQCMKKVRVYSYRC